MRSIVKISDNGFSNRVALLIYFAVFLLFFLPFPLHHSLVGDVDTFYNLSMYRQMKGYLDQLMGFGVNGTLCYPAEGSFPMKVWSFYGANFGVGILHVALLYLGMSDLWAHWMFFAILFTLNAFTLFLFLKLLFGNNGRTLVMSLFFILSHFTLANLDNINSLVFFPSFYALYCLGRSLEGDALNKGYFFLSVFLGALLIWLSPYNFVIHAVLWFILLIQLDGPRFRRLSILLIAKSLVLYLVVLSPYFYVYFFSDIAVRNLPEHITRNFIHIQSLNPDDLFRVLKNHLYFDHEIILGNPLLSKLRAAYLGAAFYLLAAIGLGRKRYRWLGLSFVVIGLILSVGPFYSYHNMRLGINPLLYPFYEWMDLYDTISVPIRFFFIVVFGLMILAGNGMYLIAKKWKRPAALWILVPLLFLENIPLPMETFEHRAILDPPLAETVAIAQAEGNAVLYLPASLEEITFNYRREYLYNYWQHLHKKDVVNGFPPFLPNARMAADKGIRPYEPQRFKDYIDTDDIDVIVFHSELINTEGEAAMGEALTALPWLQARYTDENIVVYQVIRP